VPPNIEFTTFFSYCTTKGALNCHFIQVRVPPNLLDNRQCCGAILINFLIDTGEVFGYLQVYLTKNE